MAARSDPVSWVTLGALICLVAAALLVVDKILGLDAQLASVLLTPEKPMQTITQQVVRSNGQTVTVSTVRKEGESLTDWIARHDAAVAALTG